MSVEFNGQPIEDMTRDELVDALVSFDVSPSDLGDGYVSKNELRETLESYLDDSDEAYAQAEVESDFEFVDEEDISEEHEEAIQPAVGERV